MPGRWATSFGAGRRLSAVLAGLFVFAGVGQANPTGGSVVGGSATISGTGTPSVTITQSSSTAIINWNSFSIGSGELTTFLQPNASSAVLNRVTGGSVSSIDGTLNANGQVFLINGNGIFIGGSGAVNTAGFTASTLDISNKNFEAGNLQFSGSSTATVQNLGAISATGGDIYLIGQTVDNEGSLNAAGGTVGLASAQKVLIKQSGTEHVFVSPSPTAKGNANATAVTNNGSITATTAELKAANGNMYALAINNGGTIRATTVQNQGGHVYLTSDSGTVVNTGTINASATAAGGAGGNVTLKTSGTVVHHGAIIAHGGQGGTGGSVDLSGGNVDFTGVVDLTTPGGTTGNLLLDPSSINIINDPDANGTLTTTGTITTYMPTPNYVGSELYTQTLEAQLAIANVVVDGINNVTVTDPITWGDATASQAGTEFANSLTLQTTATGRTPGTIVINAAITGLWSGTGTGTKATLIIDDAGNGFVTTGVNGTINVDNFTLKNGIWQQIVSPNAPTAAMPGLMASLPTFSVTNDFQLDNTSTFERFAGGNGLNPTSRAPNNSPYQIVDIYGLQGVGSPSDKLLAGSYILNNNIDYDAITNTVTNSTINWNGGNGTNGGAGWVPIGEGGAAIQPFSGTFDGNNFIVAGYYDYRPADTVTGLFGEASGTIENLTVDTAGGQGIAIGGTLIGRLNSGGLVENCFAGFNLVPEPAQPGNPSSGTTANQSDLPDSSLGVANASGGLIGEVMSGGTVVDSESFVSYQLIGGNGISGLVGVAGLVGVNYGTITNCTSDASGTTGVSVAAAVPAPRDTSFQNDSISMGGLVGANYGTINGGASEGDETAIGGVGLFQASILSGTGNFNIGGFVGVNYGTVDGTVTIGGRRGTVAMYQAFTTDNVAGPLGSDVDGGTGSYYIGGFVGANYGKIANGYSAPSIIGVVDTTGVALTPGGVVTGNGNLNGPTGSNAGALGNYAVGGFAGGNFGTITHSGTEDTVVSNGNINGIGTTTTRVRGVGNVTGPEMVTFANPLSLDSIFVGGFVGLNGSKSTITGSFSDPNAATIAFTLDPTATTPTLATGGSTFTIDGGGSDPLVSTTGIIDGGNGYYIVGGFAGGNYGTVSTSYSAGNVNVNGTTTQSNSFYTSGFIGINSGTVSNDYETGNATSVTSNGLNPNNQTGVVGGLIAQMNAGSVTDTYSLGTITGGTTRGGLIGVVAAGKVAGSFWDISSNAGLNYSAGGTGATGEATANLQLDVATEAASVFGLAKWDFRNTWVAPANPGFPTLLNVP